MKHFTVILATAAFALVAVGSPAFAQSASSASPGAASSARPGGGADPAQQLAVQLALALKLTDEQTSKWVTIVQTTRQKALVIVQDDSLPANQKAARIQDLRKDALTQLRVILTPVQQKKLTQIIAAATAQKAGAHAPGGGGDIDRNLATALKLNATQSAKWATIVQAGRIKGLSVFQNDSLPGPQKQAQVQAIHKSALAQLRTILTPAQQKQFDRLTGGTAAGHAD